MNLNPDPVIPSADMVKILIEGAKEIVGPDDTRELFLRYQSKDKGFPTLAEFQHALDERYGTAGGQGMALRIGRAAFQHGIRRWGETTGLSGTSYRLLPFARRISTGLVVVGSLFSEAGDADVSVSEDAEHWFWQVDHCPACGTLPADGPVCYLLVGLLQAYMTWAGSSRIYRVREIECAGSGAQACLFQIDKRAME
jgi:predicted hydrocarbon binding protein